MFSFHKPKVYRSSTGCCICKAKSSSSRFTDSKKYEEDFLECFKLSTPRQGEICNACVLLVKRWKKLPAGTERNWQHVVDARAGPGMKSFTKFKSRNIKKLDEKSSNNNNNTVVGIEKLKRKKHQQQHHHQQFERELSPESDGDGDEMEYFGVRSLGSSPGVSDCEDVVVVTTTMSLTRNRRHKKSPARRRCHPEEEYVSGFVDTDYWRQEQVCCGMIFRGRNDEIMVDPCMIKPCQDRASRLNGSSNVCATTTTIMSSKSTDASSSSMVVVGSASIKTFSDSSSDSGYDESSNPCALDNGVIINGSNFNDSQGNAISSSIHQ